MSTQPATSVHVEVYLTCASPLAAEGRRCGANLSYEVTDTGVDPLARARGLGWTFYRGVARCRLCGNAANSFGKAGAK